MAKCFSGINWPFSAYSHQGLYTLFILQRTAYAVEGTSLDIFKVVYKFSANLVQGYPYEITPRQTACYSCALEKYIENAGRRSPGGTHVSCQDIGHFKRKKILLTRCEVRAFQAL
ncbi:hypothetical protein VTO42DRAFT_3533 [Malbranchea cinnamomea]